MMFFANVFCRPLFAVGTLILLSAGCLDLTLLQCGKDGSSECVPLDPNAFMLYPATGLSVTNVTDTSFTLTFVAGMNSTGSTPEIALQGGTSFTPIGPVSAKTSVDVSGLTASTTYQVRVKSVDSAGHEAFSEVILVGTLDGSSSLPRVTPGTDRCDTYGTFRARDASDNGMIKKMLCLPKPVRTAQGAVQAGQNVGYDTIATGSLAGQLINGGTSNGTVTIAPAQKVVYVIAKGIGATPLDINEFAVARAPFGAPVRTTSNVLDSQVLEPAPTSVTVQTAGGSGAVAYATITYDPANDAVTGAKPLAKAVDTDGTTPIADTGVVR